MGVNVLAKSPAWEQQDGTLYCYISLGLSGWITRLERQDSERKSYTIIGLREEEKAF